jgi:hypothetical protein
MTIFISIASYCDRLLEQTVRDALAKATRPDKLRFGIVEQNFMEKRLKFDDIKSQVRYVGIDVRDTRGACWARSLAMSLYSGETWFMQIDSHTVFDQGWDDTLLLAAARCSQMSPKFVISNYPHPFKMIEGVPVKEQTTNEVLYNYVNDDFEFKEENTIILFTASSRASDIPLKGFHIAAGFIFTHGRFVYEVPYDPHLYFEGEEQTLSVRAWTHGWDIYHTTDIPIYHLYSTGDVVTTHREVHWSPNDDQERIQRWWELDNKSKARVTALLQHNADLGIYGLGKARTLTEYANFSGIDYRTKTIAPHARRKGNP